MAGPAGSTAAPRKPGAWRLPSVPRSLHQALDRLERSEILRAAFGDEVIEHYLHAGRWEQAAYDKAVTDWELVRYFERA